MMMLASTSDKINVITGEARTVDVHADYADYDSDGGTVSDRVSLSRKNTAIVTATTADVTGSPASTVFRIVKNLNISNKEASNSATVTVQHTDGTTAVQLWKTVLAAGETLTWAEGEGWTQYAADGTIKVQSGRMLFKAMAADEGAQNVNTVQPWFPTSGALTLSGSTAYMFEGLLILTNGTTTHTTALSIGGTATFTSIDYLAELHSAAANAISTGISQIWVNTAASTVINATSTAASTIVRVSGVMRINAGGTIIPNFTFSAAPGGTNTVKRNTFFRAWPIGDNNVVSVGTWA